MTASEFQDVQRALEDALSLLRKSSPKSLLKLMEATAEAVDASIPPDGLAQVVQHLRSCGPNDRTLNALILALQAWDHEAAAWTHNTAPHSEDRRRRVLELLGFSTEQQEVINHRIPRFSVADLPIIIAEKHEPWYEARRKDITSFFWDHYSAQLLPPYGTWKPEAVARLETSVDDVISRLSDPTVSQIYPVKGLVMGYVQSGKTSHFAGLISKAADAGYRFIIVLAGTLEILREQTQRRIDKQIVGKELLGRDEYGSDSDWEEFVSHGGRPSHLGHFDWERLTSSGDDYTSLKKHLAALDFPRANKHQPFNHPENLRFASAKIAVIKKNPKRLNQLCGDLEKLSALRTKLEHVPTLVIDDESDQASINTIKPEKRTKDKERTGVNAAIVRLMNLLPRAQYVGYTATPFANVFVDPGDAEDLFPKDFIVSLPRPDGYMGVADFHDFNETYEDGDYRGNENAFVRAVKGANALPANLPRALDAFVLAGAIKLYRMHQDPVNYRFRHHTMLVHHRADVAVHDEDFEDVAKIFMYGARYNDGKGLEALRELFERDFRPVSTVRAPAAPLPASFDELKPFISNCLSRICAGKPVRIVNGEGKNRDDTPDFEQGPVWAILVGGTKLSRGYTVEGLTVSYYRRTAGTGDSLMQMGRWFGFRDGYSDLVRLFIGRSEQKGHLTVDLYHAFGAVCRDEEALRRDLLKYSAHGLTPKQVPPLVRQHAAQLPPTSRNKMFNAEISSRDLAGDWEEKTMAPSDPILMRMNLGAVSTLLKGTVLGKSTKFSFQNMEGTKRTFQAMVGTTTGEEVLAFLTAYKWSVNSDPVRLVRQYLITKLQEGKLSDWVVLLPQAQQTRTIVLPEHGLPKLATVERVRVSTERVSTFSEPRHRDAAAAMAGLLKIASPNPELVALLKNERPVLVVYFVDESEAGLAEPTVGFGIQFPGVKPASQGIVWTVKNGSKPDAVVVDAP